MENESLLKSLYSTSLTVVYIDIDEIKPSPKNFYNIDNTDELKESISYHGLRQPLEVWDRGEYFEIISGHRRYKAIRELYDTGDYGEFESLPCTVVDDIDEVDAEILLIFGNSVTRVLTDYEKMQQVKRLEELLDQRKNDGINYVGRKRDVIAKELDMSKTKVGTLQKIDKSLSEPLKEEFRSGNINTSTAEKLAGLEEEEQAEQLEKIKEGKVVNPKTIDCDLSKKKIDSEFWEFEEQESFLDDDFGTDEGLEEIDEVVDEVADEIIDENIEEECSVEVSENLEEKEVEIPQNDVENDLILDVPNLGTNAELVEVECGFGKERINEIVRKYEGKLSVLEKNINRYENVGKKPSGADLDNKEELEIVIAGLKLLGGL